LRSRLHEFYPGRYNRPVKSQTSACVAYAETSIENFNPASEKHIKTELSGESQSKRRRPALGCSAIEAEEKPKTQRLFVALLLGYAKNTKH